MQSFCVLNQPLDSTQLSGDTAGFVSLHPSACDPLGKYRRTLLEIKQGRTRELRKKTREQQLSCPLLQQPHRRKGTDDSKCQSAWSCLSSSTNPSHKNLHDSHLSHKITSAHSRSPARLLLSHFAGSEHEVSFDVLQPLASCRSGSGCTRLPFGNRLFLRRRRGTARKGPRRACPSWQVGEVEQVPAPETFPCARPSLPVLCAAQQLTNKLPGRVIRSNGCSTHRPQ